MVLLPPRQLVVLKVREAAVGHFWGEGRLCLDWAESRGHSPLALRQESSEVSLMIKNYLVTILYKEIKLI